MGRHNFLGPLLACFFILGVTPSTASAQAVYGSIIGTVTDAQGAAVVGAKVTLGSTTKGTTEETTTNESGNYAVTHLIPGTYSVHVEAPGFKAYDVPSVAVSADTAGRGQGHTQRRGGLQN